MVSKEQKKLIDYLIKLAKKQKIVYITDVHRDEATPDSIRNYVLFGNISTKLMHYYAYKNGLRVMPTTLGSIRAQRVIVFMDKNEKYINKKVNEHNKLLKEYHKIKAKLDEKEKEILNF